MVYIISILMVYIVHYMLIIAGDGITATMVSKVAIAHTHTLNFLAFSF